MKRWKIVVVLIIFIVAIIYVINYVSNPERQIKKFVTTNSEELTSIAEGFLQSGDGEKVYKGIEIDGVFSGDNSNDIVQFHYLGKKIFATSKYYGFIYSKNDTPTAYQNSYDELYALSDEDWEWADKKNNNSGKIVKITKNWFYFEVFK